MAIGKAILGWTLLAINPLTLVEPRGALLDLRSFDNLERTIPTICGPFLRITDKGIVNAEHASVMRFFLRGASQSPTAGFRFNTGEMYMKMLGVCCDALLGVADRASFSRYASWNLVKHLRLADAALTKEVDEYLKTITTPEASMIIQQIKLAAVADFNKSQIVEAEKLLLGATVFARRKFGMQGVEELALLSEIGKVYGRQERFKDAADCFLTRPMILKERNASPQDFADDLVAAAESLEWLNPPDVVLAAELRVKVLTDKSNRWSGEGSYKRTVRDWGEIVALACNLEA